MGTLFLPNFTQTLLLIITSSTLLIQKKIRNTILPITHACVAPHKEKIVTLGVGPAERYVM